MKKELALCGTRSGRDIDKMQALQASFFQNRFGADDGFKGCRYHIECRILFRSDMNELNIEDNKLLQKYYPNGDSHTMYVGEIIGVSEEAQ